jgi:hypothetical protein
MRVAEDVDGLGACCAQAVEDVQNRAGVKRKAPSMQDRARRLLFLEFVRVSGIYLCYFCFDAAAAVRGSGVMSIDQIAQGRMYMLAR